MRVYLAARIELYQAGTSVTHHALESETVSFHHRIWTLTPIFIQLSLYLPWLCLTSKNENVKYINDKKSQKDLQSSRNICCWPGYQSSVLSWIKPRPLGHSAAFAALLASALQGLNWDGLFTSALWTASKRRSHQKVKKFLCKFTNASGCPSVLLFGFWQSCRPCKLLHGK